MGIAKAVGRGEKSAMGPNPVAPGSGSLLSRPAVKHLPVRMSDTLLDCPTCPTPCLNLLIPAIGNSLHPAVKKQVSTVAFRRCRQQVVKTLHYAFLEKEGQTVQL